MHGTHIHISGSFRNYGKKVINYGRASAMNESGAYNEFVLQNLTANSDEPVVLGADMSWEFENETPGRGLTFTTDSYFYIEKVQTINSKHKLLNLLNEILCVFLSISIETIYNYYSVFAFKCKFGSFQIRYFSFLIRVLSRNPCFIP